MRSRCWIESRVLSCCYTLTMDLREWICSCSQYVFGTKLSCSILSFNVCSRVLNISQWHAFKWQSFAKRPFEGLQDTVRRNLTTHLFSAVFFRVKSPAPVTSTKTARNTSDPLRVFAHSLAKKARTSHENKMEFDVGPFPNVPVLLKDQRGWRTPSGKFEPLARRTKMK